MNCRLAEASFEAESRCYGKHGAEHKYVLHLGKRYIPKLLPAVLYAVNGARLIKFFSYSLKTRYKRQKRRTERGPNRDYTTDRHNVIDMLKEDCRLRGDTQLHKPAVCQTVYISLENKLPDQVRRARDRGTVKYKRDH